MIRKYDEIAVEVLPDLVLALEKIRDISGKNPNRDAQLAEIFWISTEAIARIDGTEPEGGAS